MYEYGQPGGTQEVWDDLIKLAGVTKRYQGGKVAVDSLNLEVRPGEIFGFLGPNGAGKTTTIKLLIGLLTPDEGQIEVRGIDVLRDPVAAKRCIGYVPDNPDLYDRLTGLEYLNFIADVFEVPVRERQERILRFGDMFELTADLTGRISGYSHGMQQKLALISALVHQPPVWILDEPMVGLDPRAAHVLKGLMAEHVRAGNIVFFSTHVLEVAERLCDRVGIINHGKLVAYGTLAELRRSEGDGSLEQIFLELTGA